MHPDTAKKLAQFDREKISLRFGLLRCQVMIHLSAEEAPDLIEICPWVAEYLQIPLFCRYELISNRSGLEIGPYIGILPELSEERMYRRIRQERRTRASLFDYVRDYEKIGGAILAFSEESVDMSRSQVTGYVYNPEEDRWVKGVYAYPSALFKKKRISKELEQHFHWFIGKKQIFNTPVFNKWHIYKMIEEDHEFRSLQASTVLYRKPKDIFRMLDLYGEVYVKPIEGENGIGILKVSTEANKWFVQTHHHYREREYRFKSAEEAASFFEKHIPEEQYIVQEGIPLFADKDRNIDFRLILVKDQDGQWNDMGIYARYGPSKSVITNMNAGAVPERGEITLHRTMRLSEDETLQMRKRMSSFAKAIARHLDECTARCGNLGFDLALDYRGRLKLIEVNQVDPGHGIADEVGCTDTYYRIRLFNMLYLKRLAGF